MYCASSTKASQYTSRWGIANKHNACLERSTQRGTFPIACLQMMAIFLGLGADEILSISSSILWLLVILVVPGPQLLADLHVRTDILGIQLISSIIAGWPVKEVVLAPGAGRILEPKPTPPSIKNNRACSTSDIGSDVQPLSLFQFSSVTV